MDSTSLVTQLGAGSGIDMAQLASNLARAQFDLRNQRLASRGETLERQISSASTLRNSLSQLSSALGDRVRSGDLAPAPQISNPAIAKASTAGPVPGSGSYILEVTRLAQAQTMASPAFAESDTAIGAGTLTLRFGITDAGNFTEEGNHPPVTVNIASGSGLQDIASQINVAGSGVSAYIARTAEGAQLVLKGQEGAANGFILEATETPGEEGLAAMAWHPSSGSNPARLLRMAGDAHFLVDGLQMQSARNRTGQIAPGLQLELTATNTGQPAIIHFSDPADKIISAMQDLTGALNEIASQLGTAMNRESGDLASDPGARMLRRLLSGLGSEIIMPGASENTPRSLSDLGLKLDRKGGFALDSTQLQKVLSRDPQSVTAMFGNGLYGVFATVDKMTRKVSAAGDPGSLAGSVARYERLASKVKTDASTLAGQQEQLRSRLHMRLARADIAVNASQATLSFLRNQIAAWNGSAQ
ncbi:MAG: flagellar filament capping protein FliD [Sphingomonadaceae bacterium]